MRNCGWVKTKDESHRRQCGCRVEYDKCHSLCGSSYCEPPRRGDVTMTHPPRTVVQTGNKKTREEFIDHCQKCNCHRWKNLSSFSSWSRCEPLWGIPENCSTSDFIVVWCNTQRHSYHRCRNRLPLETRIARVDEPKTRVLKVPNHLFFHRTIPFISSDPRYPCFVIEPNCHQVLLLVPHKGLPWDGQFNLILFSPLLFIILFFACPFEEIDEQKT